VAAGTGDYPENMDVNILATSQWKVTSLTGHYQRCPEFRRLALKSMTLFAFVIFVGVFVCPPIQGSRLTRE
jgi:hypothetical protein